MIRSSRVPYRYRAAFAVLLLLLAFPASVAGAASASISGRVIDATHHRPVADQPVTLAMFRGQTRLATAEATTDALGSFAFDPAPSDATGFQVLTTFQGGTYRSPIAQLTGPISPTVLKVFAPTTDPAAVAQTNWVVWVDPMPGGIVVQQDLTWKNEGTAAYIGTDVSGGVVTEVPLSTAATNVQYLGSYLNGGGRIVGNTYQGTQPIVPGKSDGTVRYVVATLDELRLVSPLTTHNLHVFVPTGLVVSAPAMTSAGQIADRGTTYQVLTAADVPADRIVTIGLTPAPQPKGHAMPFAIAGFIILSLVVVLIVRRVRKVGRRQEQMVHRPRPAQPPSRDGPSSRPSRDAASPEDTDVLLEEIAAIDIAFEEGILEPATYERVRAAAKERLATATRELPRS